MIVERLRASAAIWAGMGQMVLAGSALARAVVLAHVLSPASLGRLFLILSASGLGAVFGQTGLALVGLARVAGAIDREAVAQHVRAALELTVVVNGALLVVSLTIGAVIALPTAQNVCLAVLMSAQVWVGMLAALVRGRQQVTAAIRHEQVWVPTLQLVALCAYVLVTPTATIEGTLGVLALSMVPSVAALAWSLRDALIVTPALPRGRHRRRLIVQAAPVVGAALVWRGFADAPLWAAGLILGETSSGVFAVGQRLAASLGLPLAAVGTLLAPRVAALFARGEFTDLERTLRRGARAAAAITACGLCAVAIGGRTLLSVVYGPFYAAALPVAVVLGLAQLINSAAGIGGFMLITMDQSATLFRISLVTIAVLVALLIPCGWMFGLVGCAGTAVIAMAVQNAAMIRAVRRSTGLRVYASWR